MGKSGSPARRPASRPAGDPATRTVAGTIDELIAGAQEHTPIDPSDGKSGSTYGLVEIDGERYFLKTWRYDDDWISRLIGDDQHWQVKLWSTGILDRVPACIDHTIVGVGLEGTGPTARSGLLMGDIGAWLVPEGHSTIALDTHLRFLDHMAALHAEFWGWHDTDGFMPLENRFRFFAPDNIAPELARPEVPVPVALADEGWRRLAERSPALHDLVTDVHRRPSALGDRLRATPSTFVHGDWKLGNLGEHPDGRTILLDWAYPGQAPATWDLAWYLALNAARLPHPKEAAIEAYRASLGGHGVGTGGWWDTQLHLSMVAIMACFAWEKALGAGDELRWWEERALAGAAAELG
jgi:hypothetical protein